MSDYKLQSRFTLIAFIWRNYSITLSTPHLTEVTDSALEEFDRSVTEENGGNFEEFLQSCSCCTLEEFCGADIAAWY